MADTTNTTGQKAAATTKAQRDAPRRVGHGANARRTASSAKTTASRTASATRSSARSAKTTASRSSAGAKGNARRTANAARATASSASSATGAETRLRVTQVQQIAERAVLVPGRRQPAGSRRPRLDGQGPCHQVRHPGLGRA